MHVPDNHCSIKRFNKRGSKGNLFNSSIISLIARISRGLSEKFIVNFIVV
jgi:hypothetical protein